MAGNQNFDGPIPGENFTSDTKNYAWHRPPEFDDFDSAIEAAAKQLMSKKGSAGLFNMMENDVDVATLTDMFLTSGIGAGKWTPDFAILMAGPVSHMIYMMGAQYKLKPKLGINDDFEGPTSAYFKAIAEDPIEGLLGSNAEVDVAPESSLEETQDTTEVPMTGFMGAQ